MALVPMVRSVLVHPSVHRSRRGVSKSSPLGVTPTPLVMVVGIVWTVTVTVVVMRGVVLEGVERPPTPTKLKILKILMM